jgi:FixJ family two-component response regulator
MKIIAQPEVEARGTKELELGIKLRTIKTHRARVMQKMGGLRG